MTSPVPVHPFWHRRVKKKGGGREEEWGKKEEGWGVGKKASAKNYSEALGDRSVVCKPCGVSGVVPRPIIARAAYVTK